MGGECGERRKGVANQFSISFRTFLRAADMDRWAGGAPRFRLVNPLFCEGARPFVEADLALPATHELDPAGCMEQGRRH